MQFDFDRLLGCLGMRLDDHEVRQLLRDARPKVERMAYVGFAEFKDFGVSVMLKEAPWVVPAEQITEPKALHVCAFHFHCQGHAGYTQYGGIFPRGVMFGDSEKDVRIKLGNPLAVGGGGVSTVLKKPIPHWLRYSFSNAVFQLQLDPDGRVNMATLYLEEPRQDQDTFLSA
jgi:hypothetical protein